jgi:hypothetical protein
MMPVCAMPPVQTMGDVSCNVIERMKPVIMSVAPGRIRRYGKAGQHKAEG